MKIFKKNYIKFILKSFKCYPCFSKTTKDKYIILLNIIYILQNSEKNVYKNFRIISMFFEDFKDSYILILEWYFCFSK